MDIHAFSFLKLLKYEMMMKIGKDEVIERRRHSSVSKEI